VSLFTVKSKNAQMDGCPLKSKQAEKLSNPKSCQKFGREAG
jgi:hypothetical protein